MKQFYYRVLRFPGQDEEEQTIILCEEGLNGWELISVVAQRDENGKVSTLMYLKKTTEI